MTTNKRGTRVADVHQVAAFAFRMAAFFAVVSVGWSAWILWKGGSWWGPLHTFAAGTVILVISGASQMFTVTWSAAAAPSRRVTVAQRWLIGVGTALVVIGRTSGETEVVGFGAILVIAGLVTLALSLVSTVRRSLLRRFDLSARFYVLGLGAAIVGVVLGSMMASGYAGAGYYQVRITHFHLNVIGFVGCFIVGTLPTLLPTIAHHKAVSGKEAVWAWRLAIVAVLLMASGVVWGTQVVGAGSGIASVSLLMVLGGVVVRLGRRGLEGRLPYLQVVLGALWLATWGIVDAFKLLSGSAVGPFAGLTMAAVTVGVGQVLAGSLAYLLAVLAGPGPKLGGNMDRTHSRAWLPLLAANGAGIALLVGSSTGAAVLGAIWVGDFAYRIIGLDRSPRPDIQPPSGTQTTDLSIRSSSSDQI